MTYSAVVPTARLRKLGRAGTCIQASTAAAIFLSWGIPAAIIKQRPVMKRPNAIHLGSMANLIVSPHDLPSLTLRRAPTGGKDVGVRRSEASH